MRYQLVIFDFDGTLADSRVWVSQAIDRLARRHRFRALEGGHLPILPASDSRQLMEYLGIPAWKMPLIAANLRAMMAEEIDQISLFLGAGRLLRLLADHGATLAVASSNSLENVRHVLGPRLAALVSHYECGISIFGKAARLKRILKLTDLPPHTAIYVGDETRDSEAARKCGMAFGAATWGFTPAEAFSAHSPTHLFEAFPDIARAVL